jgi:hypothetical protein
MKLDALESRDSGQPLQLQPHVGPDGNGIIPDISSTANGNGPDVPSNLSVPSSSQYVISPDDNAFSNANVASTDVDINPLPSKTPPPISPHDPSHPHNYFGGSPQQMLLVICLLVLLLAVIGRFVLSPKAYNWPRSGAN